MTIPFFIVLSLLVGASIAFAARLQIRAQQRSLPHNRYLWALLLLEISLVMPAGLYFATFYPDWSWMYLVDSRNLPTGTSVMAIASYPVAAALGYLVGYFSARCASDWVTLVFMVFVFLSMVMLLSLSREKICLLGTYEQYHRNIGLKSFSGSSLLPSSALAALCISISWGYVIHGFWREGKLSSAAHR